MLCRLTIFTASGAAQRVYTAQRHAARVGTRRMHVRARFINAQHGIAVVTDTSADAYRQACFAQR